MSDALDAAHRKLTDQVIDRDGVSGTAIGEHDGKPCLKVYVSTDEAAGAAPRSVDGFPVVVENTGVFRRR